MTEIDLYVNLLDDKNSNVILKELKESVPGFSRSPTLQQKKTHIRNLFKGKIKTTKKTSGNLFYNHLIKYRNTENDNLFKNLNSEELLEVFQHINDIPDSVKLAIGLVYNPELIKSNFNDLIKNYEEDKPIFYYGVNFKSDEDVKTYLRKSAPFIGKDSINNFLEIIYNFLNEKEKEQLKVLEETFISLTLIEFIEQRESLSGEFRELIYLAYARTHLEEDSDIRLGMILDSVHYLFDKRQQILKDKKEVIQSNVIKTSELNTISNDNLQLKEEIKDLKSKIKEYEKTLLIYEKEKSKFNAIIKNQNNEIEKITLNKIQEFNLLEKEKKNIIKNHENKVNKLFSSLREKELEIENINNEFNTENEFREFAVIYTIDGSHIKRVFPEITSFSIKEWIIKKNLLKEFSIVYVQRDGLNTNLIYEIQDFCEKNKVRANFFDARNTKEVIEIVSHYKRKLEEE